MPIPINMIRDTCEAYRGLQCIQCPKGAPCRERALAACRAVVRCMHADFALTEGRDHPRLRDPRRGHRTRADRSLLAMLLGTYRENGCGW